MAKKRFLTTGRLIFIGCSLIISAAVSFELATSYMQSHFFSAKAKKAKFVVKAGAGKIIFPVAGPYDERLGYTKIPAMVKKMEKDGARIVLQADWSDALLKWRAKYGITPPYREKSQTGLRIYDRNGRLFYEAKWPRHTYRRFADISELIVKSLIAVENKELFHGVNYKNPVVEWDRLFLGVAYAALRPFGVKKKIHGASTLATQMEKFRHSPEGKTANAKEKLRQMVSASLRVYMDGRDTRNARKEIVLDYINSVPLGGLKGFGEIVGLGDGLWAWYGIDPDEAAGCLSGNACPAGKKEFYYKAALSLSLAQRKPYWYLVKNKKALNELTDKFLRHLSKAGVIEDSLAKAALGIKLVPRNSVKSEKVEPSKAVDAIRLYLLEKLGVSSLYELDRMDLAVHASIDSLAQTQIDAEIRKLLTEDGAREAGIRKFPMLQRGNPAGVVYSLTLWEQKDGMNFLRLQTDTGKGPFSLNDGMKLELGSTAKLRTFVAYLGIMEKLFTGLSILSDENLKKIEIEKADHLKEWAVGYLRKNSDASLPQFLEASLLRRYSASPGETFMTGGGLHTFSNYKNEENVKVPSVREALWNSINLAYIRIMRDIIAHLTSYDYLTWDADSSERRNYLFRYAEQESQIYLRKFYVKYRGMEPTQAFAVFVSGLKKNPLRLAAAYRTINPKASFREYASFMLDYFPNIPDKKLIRFYEQLAPQEAEGRVAPGGFDWQDLGYLVKAHPLELWIIAHLKEHPAASYSGILGASTVARIEIYRWLFKPSKRVAQDKRIKILVEEDAFAALHKMWKKVGFPFETLTPSFSTAIGSSGDRPASLARLLGIIISGGRDLPRARIMRLHFAERTPYETVVNFDSGKDVSQALSPAVARTAKETLLGVVRNGTAARIKKTFNELEVGGKTGTGDNRHEIYSRGGRVLSSKIINRTGTFVFFVGKFFGVLTAHVPGKAAGKYKFTSALPVQILKYLAPQIKGVMEN